MSDVEKPQKTKKQKTPDPVATKAVIYTDGGCAPNPGYAGWGFHGYLYSDTPASKGYGLTNLLVTKDGYKYKVHPETKIKSNASEIEVTSYVDAFGSFVGPSNNGAAEAYAVSAVLDHLKSKGLEHIKIISDSRYVIDYSQTYLEMAKQNNWCRRDGRPIPDKPYWQVLDKQFQDYKTANTKVEFEWIKGHRHFGNILADWRATNGVNATKRESPALAEFNKQPVATPATMGQAIVVEEPAQGRWSKRSELHPLLNKPCVYFVSKIARQQPIYYLGTHGKDDDSLGFKKADSHFGVVICAQPNALIEKVIARHNSLASEDNVVISLKLTRLFAPLVSADIERFGEDVLFIDPKRLNGNLLFSDRDDKKPITKAYNPAKKSHWAIREIEALHAILAKWMQSKETYVETDLTDLIYASPDAKQVRRLIGPINAGETTLSVQAKHEEGLGGKTSEKKIDLCVGVDMPDRTALKKLETKTPRVILLTWPTSDQAFRYATVVECDDASSIWAGVYSNWRVYAKS